MNKKDKAAELRAELEAIEKEIATEDQIDELKLLLHDLREHWLDLLRHRAPDITRDFVNEDKVSDLQERLDAAIGPRDSKLSPEKVDKILKESAEARKAHHQRRTCTGGRISYCAPPPDDKVRA